MNRKRIAGVIMTLALLAATVAGCGSNSDSEAAGEREKTIVSFGGGPSGGTFYSIAIGVSELVNKVVPTLKASSESTGGGVENLTLLAREEIDFGIVSLESLYESAHGLGEYADSEIDYSGITIMGPGQYGSTGVHVNAASDAYAIEDLKGKRVALGPAGSSGAIMWERMFELHGLSAKNGDFTPEWLSYTDAVASLTDGLVDAICMPVITNGVKYSSGVQLTSSIDVRIFTTTQEKMDEYLTKYPMYMGSTISAGLYDFIEEDLPSMGFVSLFAARGGIDEGIVYEIAKTIFENSEEFKKCHDVASMYCDPAQIKTIYETIDVPINEGALRYYKEAGMIE
ncbi:MAG: TAXI family TRAP transporter solute-binding subunit [Clostridiales Family XIII bacterium]|nr:TAXI family TRAP transporter solute-binding subunit [Clostridiales Family XIII bacterium]